MDDIFDDKKKTEGIGKGSALGRESHVPFSSYGSTLFWGVFPSRVASSCFGSLGSSSSVFGPINHIIPQANYPSSATERQETFKLICSF